MQKSKDFILLFFLNLLIMLNHCQNAECFGVNRLLAKIKIKYVFFFLGFVFSYSWAYPQKQTALNLLDSAKVNYKIGQLNRAKQFLDSAIRIRSSKQIKSNVYLFEARIYAHKKNAILSKFFTQKMLVLSPFIRLKTDEFPEIRQTVQEAQISPRLSFEPILGFTFAQLIAGASVSSITKGNSYSIRSYNVVSPTFMYGLITNYYLRPRFFVSTGMQYFKLNYLRKNYLQGIGSNQMEITMNYLQLPLVFNYDLIPNYFNNKITPFGINVGFGAYYSILTNSYANMIRAQNLSGKIDTYNYFKKFNPGLSSQISFTYRLIPQAMLKFKLEYTHDIGSVTGKDIFFYGQGDELIFDYYQNMDDLRLNYVKFEISFNYFFKYKIFNKIKFKKSPEDNK